MVYPAVFTFSMTTASDRFSPSKVKILFGLAVSTGLVETVSAAFKCEVTAAIQPPHLMLVLNFSVFRVYIFDVLDFEELQTGIQRVSGFIFSYTFHIDKAITAATKAAYLAVLIRSKNVQSKYSAIRKS